MKVTLVRGSNCNVKKTENKWAVSQATAQSPVSFISTGLRSPGAAESITWRVMGPGFKIDKPVRISWRIASSCAIVSWSSLCTCLAKAHPFSSSHSAPQEATQEEMPKWKECTWKQTQNRRKKCHTQYWSHCAAEWDRTALVQFGCNLLPCLSAFPLLSQSKLCLLDLPQPPFCIPSDHLPPPKIPNFQNPNPIPVGCPYLRESSSQRLDLSPNDQKQSSPQTCHPHRLYLQSNNKITPIPLPEP